MYLPLKFPNGQFPLKIPGPISQATLEQNKKNKKFTRGGVYTWVGSVFPKCKPQTGSSLFIEAIFKQELVKNKL
jgi:hypothetical protein